MPPPHNLLFYGDNLTVLRDHIADASVDLVYLDPPFKSDQNYNVLFADQDGTQALARNIRQLVLKDHRYLRSWSILSRNDRRVEGDGRGNEQEA